MSRKSSPLGVTAEEIIYLCELAKGKHTGPRDIFFYDMFLDPDRYGSQVPDRIEEVIDILRAAWWVEQEDLIQFCYMFLLTQQDKSLNTMTKYYLTWALQAHLVYGEQVFSRQSGWEQSYKHEILASRSDTHEPLTDLQLKSLLRGPVEFSRYEKYLIYCFSRGLTQVGLASLTMQHRKIIYDDLNRLRESIQNREKRSNYAF